MSENPGLQGSPSTHIDVTLDPIAAKRARDVVVELGKRWNLTEELAPFAPHRFYGETATRPVLHLEDVSGIPFLNDIPGIEEYQHRARVRARCGDYFVAMSDPAPGYEEYCRGVLGLGEPSFVQAPAGESLLAVARACCGSGVLQVLADLARREGGLVLHPYMAIEDVWTLAARIAQLAGVPVSVLGPPPPVLWLANDKSLLSEVVTRVLDESWVVETHRGRSVAQIEGAMKRLAVDHDLVGLKRTRCASAMGNLVFDSATVRAMTPAMLNSAVVSFLERTEWPDGEEVLVVEWADTDLSPSTQLWIPPLGQGRPVLDGVYEQLLTGPEKIFVGSRPSTLPHAVNSQLAQGSLLVGAALQELGYVGRCSFDFIVLGDVDGEFQVKFTECNGRWGGTSTPMHLMDRLICGSRPPYIAQDYFLAPELVGLDFPEILRRVGDHLYDPTTGKGRFIFYNVGSVVQKGKLDIISLGRTDAEASEGVHEVLPALLART